MFSGGKVLRNGAEMLHDSGKMLHDGGKVLHDGAEVLHEGGKTLHDSAEVLHDSGKMLHDGAKELHDIKKIFHTKSIQKHLAAAKSIAKIRHSTKGGIGKIPAYLLSFSAHCLTFAQQNPNTMNPIRSCLVFGLSLLWLGGCKPIARPTALSKKPKNIILLIGDGMGLTQVSSLFLDKNYQPHFGRFPVVGLIQTSSASHKITDSAAGATAFATGKRTYNGAIGVGIDSLPLRNICEIIAPKGIATGVVATSSITDATPACFYAHAGLRKFHEDIAAQLHSSTISYFAGGGLDFFIRRKDGLNYWDTLKKAGFAVDSVLRPLSGKKRGFLAAANGMPKVSEGRGDFLLEATRMGVEMLSQNPGGFFLMVEGSQIDWGGHKNDDHYIRTEMLDFDKTLGWVLDYAQTHGETLVVVTADHETGGYALSSKTIGEKSDYNDVEGTFTTKQHTASLVPVFAYGPGAELFAGVYPNTAIFSKILAALQMQTGL